MFLSYLQYYEVLSIHSKSSPRIISSFLSVLFFCSLPRPSVEEYRLAIFLSVFPWILPHSEAASRWFFLSIYCHLFLRHGQPNFQFCWATKSTKSFKRVCFLMSWKIQCSILYCILSFSIFLNTFLCAVLHLWASALVKDHVWHPYALLDIRIDRTPVFSEIAAFFHSWKFLYFYQRGSNAIVLFTLFLPLLAIAPR